MPNRKYCFVIMPFSKTTDAHTEEYWTKHFESFLKPLIEEAAELEVHRSEPLRGDILRQIITDLVISPLVIADLTDRNPNVFWELGVRQSFKHCTITIAEEGTEIPFDVSVKGTLFYHPKDHIQMTKFAKQFKKAIRDCLSHPDTPDSHVLETISGRGTLFQIIRQHEALRRMDSLISECKWNSTLINSVYKRIKQEKVPVLGDAPAARFRSHSTELLVTQRYLDEKPAFYSSAEKYLTLFEGMNELLGYWPLPGGRQSVKSWFSEKEKLIYKLIKAYETKLKKAREKLLAFGELERT